MKLRSRLLASAAVASLLWLLALAPTLAGGSGGVYRIEITSDGLVVVSFNMSVGPGLNPARLPVEPVEATIEAVVNGVSVPPLYVNGTLYIPSESEGSAFVTYTGKVSVEGGVVSFNVSSEGLVELLVPPNVVLLSLPQSISSYEVAGNGTLIIAFNGPATVEFTLRELAGAPAAAAGQQESPPRAPAARAPIVLAALAAIAALAALLYLKRSRAQSSGGQARPLTEVDRLILEALEEAGGEALQSELQRATGLPKTTLWRRLRRLEGEGYVEVRREGKVNRVRLLRRPE